MMVAWFTIFFLLVFLLALGLSALFFSLRDKREREAARGRSRAEPGAPAPEPPAPPPIEDVGRSLLRDAKSSESALASLGTSGGMSEEELRFSETLQRQRDRDGVNYVTSDERPDGFFQA